MDFSEVRVYEPGDDVRSIDWKVTARRSRPHTKIFTEERDRPVIVALDLRASMHFATRGVFKAVLAARAASHIAWGTCAEGDHLGALVFNEKQIALSKEARGDRGALDMIRVLLRDEFWAPAPGQAQEGALRALRHLKMQARPGSRIYIISDFRHICAKSEALIRQLTRHSEVVLILCHDPLEAELPPGGRFGIESEGDSRIINSRDRDFRSSHRLAFESHLLRWQRLSRHGSLKFLQLSTTDNPLSVLGGKPERGTHARRP